MLSCCARACPPQARGVDTESPFIDSFGRPIQIGNGPVSDKSSKTTFDFGGADDASPPPRAREGVKCDPGQRQRSTIDMVPPPSHLPPPSPSLPPSTSPPPRHPQTRLSCAAH